MMLRATSMISGDHTHASEAVITGKKKTGLNSSMNGKCRT